MSALRQPGPQIVQRPATKPRMTVDDVRQASAERAAELSALLHAMWHDAHGQWEIAHSIAQNDHSTNGSWIHAYLHRKEGDAFNAEYWYRRAGKPPCDKSFETEWVEIVTALLP